MKKLGAAINAWFDSGVEDKQELYAQIKELMNADAKVIVPVVVDETIAAQYMEDSYGNQWCGVFTDISEVPGGAEKMLGACPLSEMVEQAYRDPNCNGVVFNVWGERSLFMDKEVLEFLLRYF